MFKACARCGTVFDGYKSAKYCLECRPVAYRELRRECRRLWRITHREQEREGQRRRYRQKCIERWKQLEVQP